MATYNFRITAPRIKLDLLPEHEREGASVLSASLLKLTTCVADFQAALELFDMAEMLANLNLANVTYRMWMNLAARDGAMTIYHFGRIVEQAGKGFKDCPSLRALVSHTALRNSRKRFMNRFLHAQRIRHSVAHSAEMLETVKTFADNSISGPYNGFGIVNSGKGRLLIQHTLCGRDYVTSHDGEVLSYSITETTSRELASIASEFYSAFDTVDATPPRHRVRENFRDSSAA